jgi:hypothetical protein
MNCCTCTTLHGDPEETPCEHAIGRSFSDCTCVEGGVAEGHSLDRERARRAAIFVRASQSCAVSIMKQGIILLSCSYKISGAKYT